MASPIVQAGPDLKAILLPQPAKCCNYRLRQLNVRSGLPKEMRWAQEGVTYLLRGESGFEVCDGQF